MIENIKIKFLENIIIFEILILFLTLITLKLPISTSGIFIPLSILVLIRNRKELVLEKELKQIFIYFGLFLLLFTFLSIDVKLSLKGLYDILRAFLMFFVTILLVKKLKLKDIRTFLLLIAFFLLAGNFLFEQSHFYGYANNQNNVSMEVFIITMVGLVCFNSKSKLNIYISILLIIISLILIFDAGTRGVILGLFFASIVMTNILFKNKFFVLIQLLLTATAVIYLFYFSRGLNLSKREEIWIPLFTDTMNNNLLFGSGLNTVKLIIEKLGSITTTAHNLFLEVFASTGIIGLSLFCFFLVLLFKYFYKQKYHNTNIHIIGVFGIIAIFVMYQVDLKFASASFLGMVFFFLGLVYSQKSSEKDLL